MRPCARAIHLILAFAAAAFPFWPASAAAPTLVLQVKPELDLGQVPPLYRPSVMLSWAEPPALERLLALPGPFGALRFNFELLTQRVDREQAFFDELLRETALLPKLLERDARVLVTMVRMPAWLSSSSSTRREPSYGYTHREAVHPKSQEAYQRFAERVARTLSPLAPDRLWYEGWNEPEADGFWKSGRQELFDTWDSLARGVRAGDPKARIGSPCFAGWSTTTPAPRPNAPALLLEDFIRFSAARPDRQASPDFICWHNFGKFPEEEWWGAASIREWLAAASLPRDLPQVVSEWNLWTTFPSEFDPLRDGAQGAAYVASTLHAMDRAGVRYQTIATLQDFRASGSTDPFHGDFGLMTRSPLIEKASFKVLAMQARLLSQRIGVEFSDTAVADANALNAIATRDAHGRMVLMVSRYSGDSRGAFIRSLGRAGYPAGRGLSISGKRLEQFIEGGRELGTGEVDPKQTEALTNARRVARSSPAAEARLPLRLQLPADLGTRWKYSIYVIDSENHNPQATFRAARTSGRSQAEAIAAAQAVGFAPTLSGTGPIPELTLERYAVVLYVLEPASAR